MYRASHPHVFHPPTGSDPRTGISLSRGQDIEAGGDLPDFAEILRQAVRNRTCAECGVDLDYRVTPRGGFCTAKHWYRWRDRRRYMEDPEGQRVRARAYYAANRERILDKAAPKRGVIRKPATECAECGGPLEGRQRVICGKSKCKDARYRRLHPESYAAREARKSERRREQRAAKRAEAPGA